MRSIMANRPPPSAKSNAIHYKYTQTKLTKNKYINIRRKYKKKTKKYSA